jgi:hypothetical protein
LDGCFSVGKQAVDELKDIYKRKIVWKSRHRGCELRIAQCSADAAFCTMWLNLYMFDRLLLFPPHSFEWIRNSVAISVWSAG